MLTTISSLVLFGAGTILYAFNNNTPKEEDNTPKEEDNSTYEYWMTLDYSEQFEYFSTNEYLRDYMANNYYSCDRHLTAQHVQYIANKLNKQFTNMYNRY